MTVAVVGSGAAGLACTRGLIGRGIRVELLDTGEELDSDRKQLIASLRQRPLAEWDVATIARIKENPSFSRDRVPRRRFFGSDFVFATAREHSPLSVEGTSFVPTYAKGGYSVVWGGSILPAAERDIETWPVRRAALEPYFRKLLREMPLSAEPSSLDVEFPLFTDDFDPIPLPAQCANVMKRLRQRAPQLERQGLRFGRARLAVRNSTRGSALGCNSCGLCLYGCAPDAIYSTATEVDRLAAEGAIIYRGGLAVQSIEEHANGVDVAWQDRVGTTGSQRYDAVFLAAGALNTTRLLMQSLRLFDMTGVLLDSQKFIVPLLTMRATANALSERKPILPGLFLDLYDPKIDPHWIHGQIYAINAPALSRLGIDLDQPPQLRRRLLAPVLQRLMLAWISLHSDHSGRLEVRLDCATHRLYLRAVRRPETARRIRRAGWRFFQLGLQFGALFVVPATAIGAPGEGHHIGGSFPMHWRPRDKMKTDVWGRPVGHRRVFAVDAAVLPSIPATTVTFTAMANAWRIGAEAPLMDGPDL